MEWENDDLFNSEEKEIKEKSSKKKIEKEKSDKDDVILMGAPASTEEYPKTVKEVIDQFQLDEIE